MGVYKVTVATGDDPVAGTFNHISIVLVGATGESDKHKLPRLLNHLKPGSMAVFEITVNRDLGELLLVKLCLETYRTFHLDNWFCKYVNVASPSGQLYQFPYYQWITDYTTVEIPEGKATILNKDLPACLVEQRKLELEQTRETHKWKVYAPGTPHCIDVKDDDVKNLPKNDQFSTLKAASFGFTIAATGMETFLKGFATNTNSWEDIEDIKILSTLRNSENSERVTEMWKEDAFFGSEYLTGINTIMIKKCIKIPDNFPVTESMVASSLGGSNLEQELQNGNIFLVDYKMLENVPTNNSINGQQQYLAAPMCLLWKNAQDQLIPIAIQLLQSPGENVPIFLPSDSEYDWLLAKIWVRNSDFQVHEIDTHLLRTHLLAEVFSIATIRQLPMAHPVYKLIIPHLRYTLFINTLARKQLIGPGGLFDQAVVTGGGGVAVLLKKAMDGLTYSSLCLPDYIASRGMESTPNYFYRDDGIKIWSAVESFVSNIVNYYYTSDEMVSQDPELQAWVAEIFKEGFLGYETSEVPSHLESKGSLIRYLTVVVFTCSAQHAAANNGQFDIYAWMPNGPTSMKSPPPSSKGVTTMDTILKALPDVNTSATGLTTVWTLSNEPLDRRRLGDYPDVRFIEETPQKFIKEFQDKLAEISTSIKERNKTMSLPYYYLNPEIIENSVSI